MTRRLCLPLLVLFAGLTLPALASAQAGFRVLRAELVLRETHWVLNADIAYRFSEVASDALRNGVPLTLEWRLVVLRERPWLWDETVRAVRRRNTVRYHSLAKLFQILPTENGETPRNYATFDALLEQLGTLREIPLLPADALRAGAHYRAKLAVRLDIEALPLPLRPIAYLTPAWRLHSPWYRWTLAN